MTSPTSSLLDRAGLDRDQHRTAPRARPRRGRRRRAFPRIPPVARCWCSTTAGSSRPPTTPRKGFGLRAVKDEAVGYAHASDLSEEAIARAADAVRAVKGGYSGTYAAAPGAHQRAPLRRRQSAGGARPSRPRCGCWRQIDAYARAKDPRVRQVSVSLAATWQVVEILRADGESYRDIRPLVRVNVSVVAGDGNRQESGSYGYGGREGFEPLHRRRRTGSTRSTRRCGRRWSISKRFRRRPARWTWCSAPAGRA